MRRSRKAIQVLSLLLTVLALALFSLSSVAQGAGPEPGITIQAPAQGTLGQAVPVESTLLAPDGSPVVGAAIQFFSPASFMSTSGEVFLGQAVTNSAGLAVFQYDPRTAENVEIVARFAGNTEYGPAESSATLSVQGSTQLYQEEAGIQVPGLNVWLIVAILGTVWSVYLMVIVLVTRIAREGARAGAV